MTNKKVNAGDLWKAHYEGLRNAPQGLTPDELEDLGYLSTEKVGKLISNLVEIGEIADTARGLVDDSNEITMAEKEDDSEEVTFTVVGPGRIRAEYQGRVLYGTIPPSQDAAAGYREMIKNDLERRLKAGEGKPKRA